MSLCSQHLQGLFLKCPGCFKRAKATVDLGVSSYSPGPKSCLSSILSCLKSFVGAAQLSLAATGCCLVTPGTEGRGSLNFSLSVISSSQFVCTRNLNGARNDRENKVVVVLAVRRGKAKLQKEK